MPGDALAVTGACMYLKRDALDALGVLDEGYPMAYEDVDYCLRAWEAGIAGRLSSRPPCSPTSSRVTRGTEVGERELASQRRFWERWGDWFDERDVRTSDGAPADRLRDRGHRRRRRPPRHLRAPQPPGRARPRRELYTLDGPPDWFQLEVPVRTFEDYDELAAALAPVEAIKVATWWNTAPWVWRASVTRGIPVYFVQDIETSYYPGDPREQHARARELPRGVPLHDDLAAGTASGCASWASSPS